MEDLRRNIYLGVALLIASVSPTWLVTAYQVTDARGRAEFWTWDRWPAFVPAIVATVILIALAVGSLPGLRDSKPLNSTFPERRKARETTDKEAAKQGEKKERTDNPVARDANRVAGEIRAFIRSRDAARPGPNERTPSGMDTAQFDEESSNLGWYLSWCIDNCHRSARLQRPGELTGLEAFAEAFEKSEHRPIEELRRASGHLDSLAERLSRPQPPLAGP